MSAHLFGNPPGPHQPPFCSRLELAALADAPGWARRHTRQVLQAWSVTGEAADIAVLVVSELVTNAVRHSGGSLFESPGPVSYVVIHEHELERVVLALWKSPSRLLIEVADADDCPPVPECDLAWDAESGRGLMLIEAIAKQWGYYQPPIGGKIVWVEVELDAC
ncbi:ATP-binding protein [Streptomyces sp. NPDC053474]|uniref:ATP-binding protein n=1 Tax=Streptomyces sp. NPDC053474 TaxID=3365704 RepID=UPI0037D01741